MILYEKEEAESWPGLTPSKEGKISLYFSIKYAAWGGRLENPIKKIFWIVFKERVAVFGNGLFLTPI